MTGWGLDLAPFLATRELARVTETHAEIGSTNDRAKDLARLGAVAGTTVIADAQTKGRGQRGRAWSSPPGAGIYASFVVRPKLPPRKAPTLTLLAGVAVRDAIELSTGLGTMIKWPNDLLARDPELYGRKLCGVLVEVAADPVRIDHAVIGVGVNVTSNALPNDLQTYATSLEAIATLRGERANLDRARILAAIASELERRLDEAERTGFTAIIEDWTEQAAGRNEQVTLTIDAETLTGHLLGVAEDGALLLQTPKGPKALHRGDLTIPKAPPRPAKG